MWLTSVGDELNVSKTEPVSIGLNVAVTVRAGDGAVASDGVWLNGERSYDTYVIVDGDVRFTVPSSQQLGRHSSSTKRPAEDTPVVAACVAATLVCDQTIWLSAGKGASSGVHLFGQRPHSVW